MRMIMSRRSGNRSALVGRALRLMVGRGGSRKGAMNAVAMSSIPIVVCDNCCIGVMCYGSQLREDPQYMDGSERE
jgi:hypothetical protein